MRKVIITFWTDIKTITIYYDNNWSQRKHLILLKSPIFSPLKNLAIWRFKVQNPWVFQNIIAPTYLVQFWLGVSQNDHTQSAQERIFIHFKLIKRCVNCSAKNASMDYLNPMPREKNSSFPELSFMDWLSVSFLAPPGAQWVTISVRHFGGLFD